MVSRVKDTVEKHMKGYNCAQAVACTYCDLAGIDEETMFKITEGYGLGMGNMQGTCGAITGAVAVIGMLNSSANLETPNSKASTYKIAKEILDKFQEKNQSTICHELKGIESKIVLRSCSGCIEDACVFLEDVMSRFNESN